MLRMSCALELSLRGPPKRLGVLFLKPLAKGYWQKKAPFACVS